MSNPTPDYPDAIHDEIEVNTSIYQSAALGDTPVTHTEIHGKVEAEIVAIQKKLGIGLSDASDAITGQVLTKKSNGNTEWTTPSGGGGGGGAVDSVNGQTGVVVLDQDDIADGATYKQYSQTEKTKLAGIETAADVTDAQNVGAAMTGATAKTTPVDADTLPLNDSAASNVLKKVTWANVKATLKSYFDTLYAAVVHTHTISDVTNLQSTIDAKVDENVAITPATKTKITYDAKGLITGGADITKSDVGLGNVDNTSDATKNSASVALTNKTIDADNNTISNLELDNIKASALVIQSEGIASNDNDTTIPTSGAVKAYADGKLTNSMSTNKLLGRGTAGTGAIEEITLGTNLSLSGTTLNATGGGSVTVEDESLIIGMRFFGF